MQVPALFIAVEMLAPSAIAATAMPVPTIAKMSAYSAAAAPESSFNMVIKVFMVKSLTIISRRPRHELSPCEFHKDFRSLQGDGPSTR